MDIRELKQLLKNSTSVLIMDNGEPEFMILDYQAYKALSESKESEVKVHTQPQPQSTLTPTRNPSSLSIQELEAIERLNKEILALKAQIEMEERGEVQ